MRPLTPVQGRLVRALVLFLSKDSEWSMSAPADGPVLEQVSSREWASLTFSGERHHLVVRWPAADAPKIDLTRATFDLPGAIVAVEAAVWAATPAGLRLTLDLLALDENKIFASS